MSRRWRGTCATCVRSSAPASGCQALFHVAAEYRLWHPRPREIYAANVDGTRNVLAAAAGVGVERVVYTSSVATLGLDPSGEPAGEDVAVTLADMVGDYKRSKFLAEQEALRWAREGLDLVIVNPTAPVGARDVKPTPDRAHDPGRRRRAHARLRRHRAEPGPRGRRRRGASAGLRARPRRRALHPRSAQHDPEGDPGRGGAAQAGARRRASSCRPTGSCRWRTRPRVGRA